MSILAFISRHARLLAFGGFAAFASNFGQTFFVALFNEPIRAEFGLSHGQFGLLYALATATSGALVFWLGALIDRTDLRRYAMCLSAALGVACLGLATAAHVLMLALALLALRLCGQGLLSHMASTSMATHFDRGRGKALSVAGVGRPLGEALFPVAGVALLAGFGWRGAWLACAGFALLSVPIFGWLAAGKGDRQSEPDAARTQQSVDTAPSTAPSAGAHAERPSPESARQPSYSRAEVVRRADFWLILLALLANPCILTGLFFHQAALAASKSWALVDLARAFSAYAAAGFVVSLLAGPLVDRVSARRCAALIPVPLAAGLIALALTDGPATPWVYLGLVGMASGLSVVISSALWAELYGQAHLGAIKALVLAAMVLSTAVMPPLMGWLLDADVPISRVVWGGAIYACVAIILMMLGVRQQRFSLR